MTGPKVNMVHQRPVEVPNSMGGAKKLWENVQWVRGSLVEISKRERLQFESLGVSASYRFITCAPRRHEITESDRFFHDEKHYRIVSVSRGVGHLEIDLELER